MHLPGERRSALLAEESINPVRWRHLTLSLHHDDGSRAQVELLRSLDWIEDYGAHVGGTIYLDMPEMGVLGHAEVLAIKACPEIKPGIGRVITATFAHTSGKVYDLKLAGETKSIGVTGTHPFWSVDRQKWVSVLDLEIGETLKTLAGTTVVESRSKREEPETVYNIEVEGDHVYRVGESGVLVHNASVTDVLSKLGCCVRETLSVTPDSQGWRQQVNFSDKSYGVVYVVKNDNGEVMKVGKATGGSAENRWAHYIYANNNCGGASVTAWAFDASCVTTIQQAEIAVRVELCGPCLWDNTEQRLGRSGRGVPGEGGQSNWDGCEWDG